MSQVDGTAALLNCLLLTRPNKKAYTLTTVIEEAQRDIDNANDDDENDDETPLSAKLQDLMRIPEVDIL